MLRYQKWPLLCPLFLYTRFLKVPVNRLLRDVIRARNLKLLGNYLWIYRNRASYKSNIARSKEGRCPRTRKSNIRNLVRSVFDDTSAGLRIKGFFTNVITARENLGPEAHESTDSVENPKEWLRISHVVESSSRGRVLGVESDSISGTPNPGTLIAR
jgi:hypothetical protein